jgi:hypothetical protein
MTANLNARRHGEIIIIEAGRSPRLWQVRHRASREDLGTRGVRQSVDPTRHVRSHRTGRNAARDLVLAGARMAMLGGDVSL